MIHLKSIPRRSEGADSTSHGEIRASSLITDGTGSRKITYPYVIRYTDDGVITLFDTSYRLIADRGVLRRIRNSTEYKRAVRELSQKKYEHINGEVDFYRYIYSRSCPVMTRRRRDALPRTMNSMIYVPKKFTKAEPSRARILGTLEMQREAAVSKVRFWKRKRERKKLVDDRLDPIYERELARWRHERDLFEIQELARVRRSIDRARKRKERLKILLSDDEGAVDNAVDEWIATVTIPVGLEFEYVMIGDRLSVDVHVPAFDRMPEYYADVSASGIVKAKKRTARDMKSDWASFCVGITFFMASHLFDCAVGTDEIIVSSMTKDSKDNEYCVCSVKFDRRTMSSWTPGEDMMVSLDRFPHAYSARSDYALRSVEPLEFGEEKDG